MARVAGAPRAFRHVAAEQRERANFAEQTTRKEQDGDEQDDAEDERAQVPDLAQRLGQQHHDDAADDGAGQTADAADDDAGEHQGRLEDHEVVGADEPIRVGVEAPAAPVIAACSV
jgi:hypothetical protein